MGEKLLKFRAVRQQALQDAEERQACDDGCRHEGLLEGRRHHPQRLPQQQEDKLSAAHPELLHRLGPMHRHPDEVPDQNTVGVGLNVFRPRASLRMGGAGQNEVLRREMQDPLLLLRFATQSS